MATVRELLVTLGVNAKTEGIAKFDKGLNGVKSSATSLLSVVGLLGAALGGITLGSLIKDSVKLASDFQDVTTSFTVMLKSADLARKTLEDLRTFSEKTPFKFTEVQELSKQLLSVGYDANELIPIMSNLGDIASGVGKEKLPYIVRALTQIRTKGRLMGQELLQLTEAGVPIIDALAKQLKVDKKLISEPTKLGITYKQVELALKSLSEKGGMYFNMMDKASKTWSGRLSEVGDIFDAFKTNFGQGFIDVLLPALASFADGLQLTKDNFKQMFREWGESLGEFVKFFIDHSAIINGLLIGLGVVFAALTTAIIAQVVSIGIALWASGITPITLLVAAVVAAVGALIWLGYEVYKAISDSWWKISLTFNYIIDSIKNAFTSFFNWIVSGFQKIYSFIDPIVDKIGAFFGKDTNITATRNLQMSQPIAAAASKAAVSSTYNNQNDNRNINVNMTLNNVKDGKRVAQDFNDVLLGVE